MKVHTGKVPLSRKSLEIYSEEEQQVPYSRGKGSVDDSSNSTPSSPSSSSFVAEDVFPLSFPSYSEKLNGIHVREEPESLSKPHPVIATSQTLNEMNQHAKNDKKANNKKNKKSLPIISVKPINGVHGKKREASTKSSNEVVVISHELDEKARLALQSLMPLLDKLPNEVVFGEDVMTEVRSPMFTKYCEAKKVDNPTHLLPSRVIEHLGNFHTAEKQQAGPSKGDGFKRPRSPHGTERWTKPGVSTVAEDGRAATSAELRERMQAKLKAFRAKRKALLEAEDLADIKDLTRKLKRLKKKEKQQKKKNNRKAEIATVTSDNGQTGSSTPSSQRSSSVISDNGKMIFSKFDFFGDEATKPNPKQITGKNLTHLLNKTEAEKKKMEDLEKTNPEKAKILAEKKAWQEAVLKAQGVKLKNDPVKLKRAMKEEQKRKDKSKKKWDAREQGVAQQKKERQNKREKNIEARKQTVKDKKRKKHIKKGHIIPGFN